MSNDFFNATGTFSRHTLARAAAVQAEFAAVKVGFDKIPTEAHIKRGLITGGADSGAADTYVVTSTYPRTAYVPLLEVVFEPLNDNTGACTIDLDALGAVSIKRVDGADPAAGDLKAGVPVVLRHDGTNFIIVSATRGDVSAAAASAAAAAASESNAADSETNAAASEAAAAASAASINLPASLSGAALNFLRVNAGETGHEYRTAAEVLAQLLAVEGVTSDGSGGFTGFASIDGVIGSGAENTATGVSAIEYMSIPADAKEVTIVFRALSGSTNDNFSVQVGSGSFATSGYASFAAFINASNANGNSGVVTSGLPIINGGSNRNLSGHITLRHIGSDKWTGGGLVAEGIDGFIQMVEGTIDLGGALDRIRIVTTGGTFDVNAGVNAHWKRG